MRVDLPDFGFGDEGDEQFAIGTDCNVLDPGLVGKLDNCGERCISERGCCCHEGENGRPDGQDIAELHLACAENEVRKSSMPCPHLCQLVGTLGSRQ